MNDIKILEISAFLDLEQANKDKRDQLLYNILFPVFKHKTALKKAVIDLFEDKKDNFVSVTLDISKISKRLLKKCKLDSLLSGKVYISKCCYCGCHYITYFPYTYRDNCGCIGRSYECLSCRSLSNKTLSDIIDIRNIGGELAAKEYQISLLTEKEKE